MDCWVNVHAIPGCVVESVESVGDEMVEGNNRSEMSMPVRESDTLGRKVCMSSRSHTPVPVPISKMVSPS
jgi:hypothetical protein